MVSEGCRELRGTVFVLYYGQMLDEKIVYNLLSEVVWSVTGVIVLPVSVCDAISW